LAQSAYIEHPIQASTFKINLTLLNKFGWINPNDERTKPVYRKYHMSDLQGLKVMVIDDSSTIRRTAELFLAQVGCTVLLAEDGFAALAQINDHAPNIIFCDILMPRLDGYQTCALIKRSTKFKATRFV
jgi:PleD family two-component response regulator